AAISGAGDSLGAGEAEQRGGGSRMPRRGASIFTCYAMATFVLFTFVNQTSTLLVMSIAGAMLLIINLFGIYRLRHEIVFSSSSEEIEAQPVTD
nr:hypothetical protein [Chlamydiota bacterium]